MTLVEIERNNIPEAQRALRRGIDAYQTDPEAAQWKVLCVARSRLLAARGDLHTAREALRQARKRDPQLVAPVLDRWLLLAESELDLAYGRPDRVKERYEQTGRRDDMTPREAICLARAELALGGPHRAELVLARWYPASSDVVAAVEAQVVTALIADAHRQGNRSVDALAEAFAIAAHEGVRRPFVSIGGRQLAALIARQHWLIKENAGFVADVLADMNPNGATPDPSPPIGDLSDRELDVLRYLPTLLSASEIGDELHVSVNTIKAHLRSIYRKLGASRRREAVVRARELGIL